MNKIVIQNVVATATLGTSIDLLTIMKVFKNTEYRPKRFPGLVFRLKRPKTATLIFTTGKLVCTGAKSSKLAKRAVKKVVKQLREADFIINDMPEVEIQNIVASADFSSKVDLETAADILDNTMYEPEQFPGLIYRMVDPKTVLLLFATGKLVCTGAKSEEMVYESVAKVYEVLKAYDLLFKE